MAYGALSDLIDRAGELEILQIADRDDDGIPDVAVISAALDAAGQTIDAYLGARYALPLVLVPAIVLKWSVSIARYHLHRDGAGDNVVRDYKDALAELRDASAGRLALPDMAGLQPTQNASGGAIGASSPQVFTDQALEGYL